MIYFLAYHRCTVIIAMLRRAALLCYQKVPTLPKKESVFILCQNKIIPEYYDAYSSLAMETMGMHPDVGHCMGYWTAQVGALNEHVHLWQYDSFEHRYHCVKTLENDKNWQRNYINPSKKFMRSQSNMLLRPIIFEDIASTMNYKYLMLLTNEREIELPSASAVLAGSFQISVGDDQGKYVHIVKAIDLSDLVYAKPFQSCSSKILGATRWSTRMGCRWR